MNIEENVVVTKKRGRKSKKELQAIQEQKDKEQNNENNVEFTISEKTNDILLTHQHSSVFPEKTEIEITKEMENTVVKPLPKKRGRKPKGGKIVQQPTTTNIVKEEKPNVILHLKCSIKDLHNQIQMNNSFSLNPLTQQLSSGNCSSEYPSKNTQHSFASNSNPDCGFEIIHGNMNMTNNNGNMISNINNNINNNSCLFNNFEHNNIEKNSTHIDNLSYDSACENNSNCDYEYDENILNKNYEIKEIWRKLKMLEHSLHTNNINDKRSACFWCTYDFDNPPIYIPKHFVKDTYHVYGCFCSPECGTAFLMEENIDNSTKFERYHLLNHIYSKIYNYEKNIKPAPNPFYMLNKYYGNLSIQEYRALLRNERLFLIVDKPMTRILPELHEDNDDFIINNKIIPSNNLQVRKKLQRKTQSKTNIVNEKFGTNKQNQYSLEA